MAKQIRLWRTHDLTKIALDPRTGPRQTHHRRSVMGVVKSAQHLTIIR